MAWDGVAWQTHVPVQKDVSYHALWAESPTNVWAGGTELFWQDGAPVERASLLHYDGNAWQSASDLGAETIVAIHGPPSNLLMALPGGDIRKLQGDNWVADGTLGHSIRALWVNGANDAWAVGDKGFIAHRTNAGWQQITGEAATGDALGDNRHYVGVWASGPNDAWAIFDTVHSKDVRLEDVQIGFSHYDGVTWRVVDTRQADCTQELPFARSHQGRNPSFERGSFATRRGALLRGRSGSDILASIGSGTCLWHYDGNVWSPVEQQLQRDVRGDDTSGHLDYFDSPFGYSPPVAATTSSFFVAGRAGLLVTFDPSTEKPTTPVAHFDALPPSFKELFATSRPHLRQIVVHTTGTYALANNRPSIWTAQGWRPLLGPPGSLDPSQLGALDGGFAEVAALGRLHIDSLDNLWFFGGYALPYAAKYDGEKWVEVEVRHEGSPSTAVVDVWSSPTGIIWFTTGLGGVYRLGSEGAFSRVSVPAPADHRYRHAGIISGSADDDVWIGFNSEHKHGEAWQPVNEVVHFDGQSFKSVFTGDDRTLYIRAFSRDEMLFVTGHDDPTVWLYDGERIEALSWPKQPEGINIWRSGFTGSNIFARNMRDLYGIAKDARGKHLIHFDGDAWTRVFSADNLHSLHSDDASLWAIGNLGATARGKLSPTGSAR